MVSSEEDDACHRRRGKQGLTRMTRTEKNGKSKYLRKLTFTKKKNAIEDFLYGKWARGNHGSKI